MRKALAILLALLLMTQCALAAEIGKGGEAQPAPEYDYNRLTVGTATPFGGSFFTQMWGNVSSDLDVRLLIHGYNLIEWRSEEGIFNIDPSVVSGIIVTQNAAGDRTYTLTLYQDLYYNDGTPITARDYAFSMLLSIAPEVAAIGGDTRPLEYVQGYAAYVSGAAKALSGVRVLNDRTLAITVSHRYLPFFYELALLDCTPYPISVIAPGCRVADDGQGVYIANIDGKIKERLFTADLLRETILDPETGYRTHPALTSGPYKLVSFDGTTCEFELNEYYKGNSLGVKPSIPHITFSTVENADMIGELAAGEVMLLNKTVPADVIEAGMELAAGGDTFAWTDYMRSGLSFISFSCEKETVGSENVRKAISLCLDKDSLVADALGDYGVRADGYYGMGQWMYQLVNGALPYPVKKPGEGEDTAAYDKAIAAWSALSLDDVTVYNLNVDAAVTLLVQEGYTLNEAGEAFDPAKDAVRCKRLEDGTLVPLRLKLLVAEGTKVADCLQAHFVAHLAQAGIELTVEAVPMNDLLRQYYREEARDADMFFLATNFDVVFDPSLTFRPDGKDAINGYNPTGLADEELYRLALDMRMTAPTDLLGYCTKWVALQERFQEIVPVIPVYSSVYYDFYPQVLRNYNIAASISWSQAVVNAYLSDAPDPEAE